MNTVSAIAALAQLDGLIDQTNVAHEPILIAGERNNAVLVSEEDWRGKDLLNIA